MKKQYLVTIIRGAGFKENAVLRYTENRKRYASTLEEAKIAVDFCINEYTTKDIDKTFINYCGSIGISCVLNAKTYNDLKVISYEIKAREVTDWEVIEIN